MGTSTYEGKGNVHVDMTRSVTLPFHKEIARLVCKRSDKDSRIIDIGCGMGQIEGEVLRMSPDLRIDVADAYPACIEATANHGNVNRTFLIDEIGFDVASVVSPEYDIAIMSHVLEHLVFPAKALEDVFSVLRPGGVIVVAVPNPVRPSVFLSNLFKFHYVNRGHVHCWDRSHWQNFLERIMGYEVLEYSTDFVQLPFCTRFSALRTAGEVMVKVAPWWGFSNIAVITRRTGTDSVYARWSASLGDRAADGEPRKADASEDRTA